MQKSRIVSTAIVALIGAIIGSFSMMLFASTHFAGIAGPGNTPPQVYAAPITAGGSDQQRIVSAVRRVAPSVVALNVTVNGQQVVPLDPFAQFFGQQGPQQVQRYRARASGSGFVYARNGDGSGLIVTNAHVVRPPTGGTVSGIQVVFRSGQRVTGHLFADSIGADLAVIKVDGVKDMPPPIEIADSSKLEAGQFAIAIGEPFELKESVSLGVVSGFNRDETIGSEAGGAIDFKGLLQTSAPINPGNSGGPLIDTDGRLIGVNQSTANPGTAQGIGFAIPSNTVREQVAMLQKSPGTHQGTNQGFIGVALATVTPALSVQLNYHGKGVAVTQVVSGSAADQAGLQPGDVVVRANGQDITSDAQLRKVIEGVKPGQTVNLEVWSSGIKKLVSVKVVERPADVGALVPQQQQPQQQDPNAGP
ncbi:MAG: trypsin-like peptidase domain-containing protein [Candidatus Eremiobacteraeota bacterium]|nr:trypsin-like peptidase domain-containing protein [Candidatus Eremiobacteraeota bacterium]MBC5802025.1 trypsin-like peptidase domain-containing protein [Candidatus Eremiobacteraeota bacterium]MBC5822571.1 trypsin-like peptidase domain-containing protein [Candidatus Eremiobacteraeota bacterium]